MLSLFRRPVLSLGLALGIVVSHGAFAQEQKGKLITIIVPFTPGSALMRRREPSSIRSAKN